MKIRAVALLLIAPLLLSAALLFVTASCDTANTPAPSASASAKPSAGLTSSASPAASADAIDKRTGLVINEGFDTVAGTCTACHSGKLIAQNRGTRADWEEMMRWMQKHHNLWKLDREKRAVILAYLAKNYGIDKPKHPPRRRPLPAYLMPPTAAELAQVKGRVK